MKTMLATLLVGFPLLLSPAAETKSSTLKLTGAQLYGIGGDGKREGSYWNTANDGGYNVYLFTGPARAPKFLNHGNSDASLNPNFALAPGIYTIGFAGDSRPCPGFNLELAFNDNPQARLSVTTVGTGGEFSGTTTFTTGDATVTLTALQLTPAADLVSAYEEKSNGVPDLTGTFTLVVTRKEATAAAITLTDFKLVGDLAADRAEFTLTATANVVGAKGGTVDLLAGPIALTEVGAHPNWDLRAEAERYVAAFTRAGKYPLRLKFSAAVKAVNGWNGVDFRVAPGAVQPVTLQGLAADTQFEFTGAAKPERKGSDFLSFLPADGTVKLAWKAARKAEEGKLFYSAEMLSQISVSPGLMRQVALLDFRVMQGELSRVALRLSGAGEVTRVGGDQVLAWNVEPIENSADRRLVIQLNQAQKDAFAVQVQLQTPLGAFPQISDAIRLQPEGATRFAGYLRVVNEGAVRLEVAQASGLSQISPEQFPETDATRTALRASGSQRFAYRFSSADYALRVQADQIQPELSVSEVLWYHHGQNELALEAEIELDVREAPLRELLLTVPRGYAVAKITASGMSDYFLHDAASAEESELRIVFGQPTSGRLVVQLRLERNKPLSEANWLLPRIEVAKAKSVRGNIGVSADAGFRMTTERTQGLTEIATAFFPRKIANLQAAFRLSEPAWQATLRVERLPQTVQADAFHLFSIGEGIAYGSSVLNYVISGAPMATLRVELSDEYFNVEFAGKDVRNWQKTTNGYLVQLHSPVAGAYTLLATYERPFKPQGETLAFTGARPTDAQSEAGHTLVISAYQFQVKPADVSPGLLPLEPGEVPAEYRLFFDAPILAAYRYTARPFNLRLALSPLAQGDSLRQVVDRATLVTRISKEGQALTDVTYLVKNRGNPNFKVKLPAGVALWSATVNDASVVPVKDGEANLIPLPTQADPNTALKVGLKLASKAGDARRVNVAVPIVNAPVMLAEWRLEPDAGQRLAYVKGELTPINGLPDVSGFAQLARILEQQRTRFCLAVAAVLGFAIFALVLWRWAGGETAVRFSPRHLGGGVLGLAAACIAGVAFAVLFELAAQQRGELPREVAFLAPVQQANSALTVEVANLPERTPALGILPPLLLAGLALVLWGSTLFRENNWRRTATRVLGWVVLGWAALRLPNGVPWVLGVWIVFLVVHVLIPAVRRLWSVQSNRGAEVGSATAIATLLLASLVGLNCEGNATAADSKVKAELRPAVPELVSHQLRVEDGFVVGTAKLRWTAEKGQSLPVLFEPAVLMRIGNPKSDMKLSPVVQNGKRTQQFVAERGGTFEFEVQYQLPVIKRGTEGGITLPTPCGLVNRVELTVAGQDVDVVSPQAVSVRSETAGTNTVAALVLSPVSEAWIGWKPRSRDVKREKATFYAELTQLFVPSAGVIEGAHFVAIRPAQGELSELVITVPTGATVTDVTDAAKQQSLVSLWRFDPDARKLRITFNRPQSRPFTLLVRSQVASGTLPFEQTVGLLAVDNAANQIGVFGVATGNEVQLDNVAAENLSAINLEDFPADATTSLAAQFPGLTVRRAFRYSDVKASVTVKASPVEPDVRVEAQNTLSLGEDRTVLAANLTVDITRAGIFKLSFVMPPGYDVESISGAALSHWTESKSEAGRKNDAGRIITLNLRGKTEGRQSFVINLAGPGVKASRTTGAWAVPQLTLREAGKQQGTLVVVPEQGMQLQAATLDGLSQLDPQRSGIRQKGVLAFRILQTPWQLALDIEQVEAWIQVTGLQHATVNEAQVKVAANLQYQIENTGLKVLRVSIPTNAESVRFTGEWVADFLRVPGAVTNDLQQWEVKLQRRIIGPYLLQVAYQTLLGDQATEAVLRGVQADGVNLQRGFVTVQAGGRVQVSVESPGVALQPTEWQSVPRALQQNLQAAAANFAFRLADPTFQLRLKLDRHEAVKLLPARVNSIALTSVISDAGVMLTQVRLEMLPGDKRLLSVKLPKDASYWFAFVNQNGVWPWRQGDEILIPLDPQSRSDKAVPVEIFYSSSVGRPGGRALDLELLAPKFDLPLENITWRVHLNDKWQVKDWTGTLQLQEQQVTPVAATVDLNRYMQSENAWQQVKTKEAEEMLALGNNALAKGDPQQARRAFQAAYGLSTHDNAFNEDARVQLHNLKLQQALVGLNVRQAATAGDTASLGNRFRDLRSAKDVNYTQQDAKEILDRNNADDNSAYLRLAERLVQQQDAAVTSAGAIRANIPEQGRVLTFQRTVAVDREADLRIGLQTSAAKAASWGMRASVLAAAAVLFGLLAAMGRWVRVDAGAKAE